MTISLDKINTLKTTTYAVNSDIYKNFYIDVVDDGESRHAYIYHNGSGHKMFLFGTSKEQDTLAKFLEILQFEAEDDIATLLEENSAMETYYNKLFMEG